MKLNTLIKQFTTIKQALFYLFVIFYANVQAQNNLVSLNPDFKTKDTLFKEPYIDVDEWREVPVYHRYVHGGFMGTETRFSFYFPTKEQYKGHFFQYITPVPDSENISQGATGEEDKIGFSITSGAYFIETNGGGRFDFTKPGTNSDPTIGAYRANAASAQFSRVVAMEIFGCSRPFGYAFGGSGGAYRTIGGIENTVNVWDGAVPYVPGSPMAIPNVFTVRIHAIRILKDKLPQIADAIEPGGSGNMYAGLNTEEKEALQEVTKMGFPINSWFSYEILRTQGLGFLFQSIVMSDPKYFAEDFWNLPGYLGSDPNSSIHKARIQLEGKIKNRITIDEAVKMGLMKLMTAEERGSAGFAWKVLGEKEGTMPVGYQLGNSLPDLNFLDADFIIKTGEAKGEKIHLEKVSGDKVIIGNTDPKVLAKIKPGDKVMLDNSNFLAAQTYHRHQVPGKEYHVWDQYRDKDSNPIYPQRPRLIAPLFTQAASGISPIGKFKGKMILCASLWDRDALPWQADWYRSKVIENLGETTDDNFRLWYTDHALHSDLSKPEDPTHVVSYLGVLQQALRDLSDWVEKGIEPPTTTNYKIEDGQVVVPPTAAERQGIQPVVTLKANGGTRADVKVGQPVTFTATVEVPSNTGKVVAAEWDFKGEGTFPVTGKFKPVDKTGSRVTLKATYTFTKPGTYFPILKVASQQQGDEKTPFARIQNLDRVRVVVK